MRLPTSADLPLRSPIVARPQAPERATEASVSLADLTGLGLLQLRGSERAAGELLSAAHAEVVAGGDAPIGDLPSAIGEVRVSRGRLVARLTGDEWLMVTTAPAAQPHVAEASARMTATDLSHGYATALLAGPSALLVLAKLCGLDFSEQAFPNLRAAQTSLAKVRALVLRRDYDGDPAYLIAVGRSLGGYLWEQLLDAAGEFQAVVVGSDGLAAGLMGELAE